MFDKYLKEDEIIELIREVIACPSHTGIDGQETLTAIKFEEFFKKHGIAAKRTHVIDGRENIIATLKGQGGGKTLLLTGHTDTVPPYDMENPYDIKIVDGKVFGRGTVDMKSALACMAYAMVAVKNSNIPLLGDVVFAGVIDEEEKSEGTISFLKENIKIDAAIVGEPTNMDICLGHKGLEWLEINFIGKTVHGGKQKEGINAIQKAAKFIGIMENELIPKIEGRMHPLIGNSSMNYGYIQGGTQPSTVAGECVLKIDRRWIPGEKYVEILKEYTDVIDEITYTDNKFKAEMKIMDESVMRDGHIHDALLTDENEMIVISSKNAIKKVLSKDALVKAFTAWSDGGLLSSSGKIPTIVLGPGELESAHSATEHIAVCDLLPATKIYAQIIADYCK